MRTCYFCGMNTMGEFLEILADAVTRQQLVKLTLSKPVRKSEELQNVFIRPVELKNTVKLSFTFHYNTKDITKNFDTEEGLNQIVQLLNHDFKNATLLTIGHIHQLQQSKKGKINIRSTQMDLSSAKKSHDKEKIKLAPLDSPYLFELGVTDNKGNLIPKMADKYRQINKYLEIMSHLLEQGYKGDAIHLVDMGSGKGYLTFALYDYLSKNKKWSVRMTGIELRQHLVDFCNQTSAKLGFDGLRFINQRIEDFKDVNIDVLIALHACDTATDDALAKAIMARAELIVCAPCCHKQVRQQVKGKAQSNPLLKFGIFQERHFEMVTDTIRALILEQHGYKSKVFEFVSNEHTRKNIMLIGSKSKNVDKLEATEKINALKKEYHIDYQYLEQLVNFN